MNIRLGKNVSIYRRSIWFFGYLLALTFGHPTEDKRRYLYLVKTDFRDIKFKVRIRP